MAAPRSLSAVLDAAERAGKLNLRMQDICAALPGASPAAQKQQQWRVFVADVAHNPGSLQEVSALLNEFLMPHAMAAVRLTNEEE